MIIFASKNKIGMDLNLLKNNNIPWHMRILQGGRYIKQINQGLFAFNFMGSLVVNNISNILRNLFIKIGGNELIFPIIQEKKIWYESGRIVKYKKSIGQIDKNFILSPSHEELCNSMIDKSLSYKNLPLINFSISHCFRKEIRPKNGLLRTKEFILFDGYAFSSDSDQHNEMFNILKTCIESFLLMLGISFRRVFFSTNDENNLSEEFVIKTDHIGEKRILHCLDCGNNYRASQFKSCQCGGNIILQKGIEFADLIRNGTTFAKKSNSFFICKSGNAKPYYMLSFGLGISKLMAVLVELSAHTKNFIWPMSISPFRISVIPHKDSRDYLKLIVKNKKLTSINVLIDDRNLSIGRRIIENKNLGIPILLIIKNGGKKFELIDRTTKKTVNTDNFDKIILN